MSDSNSRYKDAPPISTPLSGKAEFPWWLRIIVVLGAILIAAGGVIALVHPAMMVSPHDEMSGAVHIYAGYLASRNLVLAVMLLVVMNLRARGALNNLMVFTAFVQVVDAGIDCTEGRWAIVPGILVFGLVFLWGSARLCGYPFWRREAWR